MDMHYSLVLNMDMYNVVYSKQKRGVGMNLTQPVVFRHHRVCLHPLDTPALSFTRCFRLNGGVPPVTLCFRANVDGSLVEVFLAFRLAVKALPPLTDIALKEGGARRHAREK